MQAPGTTPEQALHKRGQRQSRALQAEGPSSHPWHLLLKVRRWKVIQEAITRNLGEPLLSGMDKAGLDRSAGLRNMSHDGQLAKNSLFLYAEASSSV